MPGQRRGERIYRSVGTWHYIGVFMSRSTSYKWAFSSLVSTDEVNNNEVAGFIHTVSRMDSQRPGSCCPVFETHPLVCIFFLMFFFFNHCTILQLISVM